MPPVAASGTFQMSGVFMRTRSNLNIEIPKILYRVTYIISLEIHIMFSCQRSARFSFQILKYKVF